MSKRARAQQKIVRTDAWEKEDIRLLKRISDYRRRPKHNANIIAFYEDNA